VHKVSDKMTANITQSPKDDRVWFATQK